MGAWVMPNGNLCTSEDPDDFVSQVAAEAGCRWTGGYCELVGSGDGRERSCPGGAAAQVLARAPVQSLEELMAASVGQGQAVAAQAQTPQIAAPRRTASSISGKTQDTRTYTYNAVQDVVRQGVQAATGVVQDIVGEAPRQPVVEAGLIPAQLTPWLIGGLALAAVGAGIIYYLKMRGPQ